MTKRAKYRTVDIEVSRDQLVLWTCAAALEPVPPTWLGPTWAEVLATPADLARGRMMLDVPTRFLAKFTTRDDREQLFYIVPSWLTDQALLILERHGLQPIPIKYTRDAEPEDGIPF